MTTLRTILAALLLCIAPAQAQTLKSLMYNTTNGQVVYSGTNDLNFPYPTTFNDDVSGNAFESSLGSNTVRFDAESIQFSGSAAAATRTNLGLGATNNVTFNTVSTTHLEDSGQIKIDVDDTYLVNTNAAGNAAFDWGGPTLAAGLPISFSDATNAAITRTNLGLGATWLTNSNVTNFRTAIGLGATNEVLFGTVLGGAFRSTSFTVDVGGNGIEFEEPSVAAITRTNLGLGGSNIVTFAGLNNNGDITINQTATNNGLLYIYRTNAEPFLGLANLIASNNTTISNETLFRVGVSEATNKAAQFGFRSTNTNGDGVAVFSVFGFNALMMVGADASTNAVIYSGGGTNNEVMTLVRDGATEFARPIRFSTNAATKPATNAPANTTNVAAWVEFRIGTNSYRAPLYQ